jgi:hypothetical protein
VREGERGRGHVVKKARR